MKQASRGFSDEERAAIEAAVREAEKGTRAEIVPVVCTVSGRYDRAEDLFGVAVAMLAVAAYWWVGPWITVGWRATGPNTPLWPILLLLLGGFVLGAALATAFPVLRLLFLPEREMSEEVAARARAVFQEHRVRATRDATGVLLFVSLYERQVRILPDDAVASAVPATAWQGVADAIVGAMREGRPADGLVRGINAAGELLRAALPGTAESDNELRDSLILLDG